MELDRIHNYFTYEDEIFIKMSIDELKQLRFDLSIARVCLPDVKLEAIDSFIEESGNIV